MERKTRRNVVLRIPSQSQAAPEVVLALDLAQAGAITISWMTEAMLAASGPVEARVEAEEAAAELDHDPNLERRNSLCWFRKGRDRAATGTLIARFSHPLLLYAGFVSLLLNI